MRTIIRPADGGFVLGFFRLAVTNTRAISQLRSDYVFAQTGAATLNKRRNPAIHLYGAMEETFKRRDHFIQYNRLLDGISSNRTKISSRPAGDLHEPICGCGFPDRGKGL